MFRVRTVSCTSLIQTQSQTHCLQYQWNAIRQTNQSAALHTHRLVSYSEPGASTRLPIFTPRISQSDEIRSSFLNYFQSHHHQLRPSPLLFPQVSEWANEYVTPGMIQFKDMFLGLESPPVGLNGGRFVTVQKCVRDEYQLGRGTIDEVAEEQNFRYTPYHTFFEMLSNVSVGKSSKEEALVLAWNYLTEEIGLPPSRLILSHHSSDDEIGRLWSSMTGNPPRIIASSHVRTLCGPLTRILFDQGRVAGEKGNRQIELWKLTSMEYAFDSKTPLPEPGVDSSVWLEQLASLLQHQPTTYDSDLLRPSIDAVRQLALSLTNSPSTALPYTNGLDTSSHSTVFKLIVDHLRGAAFMIVQGCTPSDIETEGGCVLRRIIRQAIRFGTTIGIKQPFLTELLDPLINKLGPVYPELIQHRAKIAGILEQEELTFLATLLPGLKVLDKAFAKLGPRPTDTCAPLPSLPGEVAFRLYNSHGFPFELTETIVRERGAKVDTKRFEELMAQQKEQSTGLVVRTTPSSNTTTADSRTTSAEGKSNVAADSGSIAHVPIPKEVKQWQSKNITNRSIRYDQVESDGPVKVVASEYSPATNSLWLALDASPFYANQDGQVGDIGELFLEDGTQLQVVDCLKSYDGCSVVRVHLPTTQTELTTQMRPGTMIARARVDPTHRSLVAIHHTASHLLRAALKQLVIAALPAESTSSTDSSPADERKNSSAGAPLTASLIDQAGSLATSDRLRIDFRFPIAITAAQLTVIETWINQAILAHILGTATAADGASYQMSTIAEICRGMDVLQIRSVYPFKILSEGSIASGIRRIEAVAGPTAVKYLTQAQTNLKSIVGALHTPAEQVTTHVTKLQSRVKELEKENVAFKCQALLSGSNSDNVRIVEMNWPTAHRAVPIKIHPIMGDATPALLRACCLSLNSSDPMFYHLLLCSSTGACAITTDYSMDYRSTGDQAAAGLTASELWQWIETKLTQDGPLQPVKGGGLNKMAHGQLLDNQTNRSRTIAITRLWICFPSTLSLLLISFSLFLGILPTVYTRSPTLPLHQRIIQLLTI